MEDTSMTTKSKKVYLASPWFNDYESSVEEALYSFLKEDSDLNVYSPRRDGTKLDPGEFHDHEKRKLVFADNVNNIDDADLVVANIDPYLGHLDTGTVWEVGYALSKNVPVILYTGYGQEINGQHREYEFEASDLLGFNVSRTYSTLSLSVASNFKEIKVHYTSILNYKNSCSPAVYLVAPRKSDEDLEVVRGIENVLETLGVEVINSTSLGNFGSSPSTLFASSEAPPISRIESSLSECDGVIAVIDDRDPFVSMVMGAAYSAGKPIISFTNFDYGVNLMLMLSIVRHVKGLEELTEVAQLLSESGFKSLGEHNSEGVRVI
ncbi:nucleoside 2-deoxyribosyltransferase [Listeria phage LIS04]|nr:nucleoside 2-deoxyribosyltransferase [Listeria phage LIS04]